MRSGRELVPATVHHPVRMTRRRPDRQTVNGAHRRRKGSAVLGVLLVLSWLLTTAVVGAAGWSAVRTHRQFTRSPGAFRCRLRVVRGNLRGVGPEWRQVAWASWVHDVLLVRIGRLPATTHVLQVRFPEGSVEPVRADGLKGFGTGPVMLRLRLDEGAVVEVAASATHRELLPGPFLVA